MKTKITIGAVQCPVCLDVIISRSRHDYRFCSCMTTAIDGGRDYTRVGFKNMPPHNLRIDLVGGLTAHLLGVEENKHLGLLKTKNVVYDTLYRYTLNERGDFRRYAKK